MNLTFSNFLEQKFFMLNLNKKNVTWTSYIHIKKFTVFNLKCNLKLETFDHRTFLYKVHDLLLKTLQRVALSISHICDIFSSNKKVIHYILRAIQKWDHQGREEGVTKIFFHHIVCLVQIFIHKKVCVHFLVYIYFFSDSK